MREGFINPLIFRVHLGVDQPCALAPILLRHQFDLAGVQAPVTAHRIAWRVALLVVAIFVDKVEL